MTIQISIIPVPTQKLLIDGRKPVFFPKLKRKSSECPAPTQAMDETDSDIEINADDQYHLNAHRLKERLIY